MSAKMCFIIAALAATAFTLASSCPPTESVPYEEGGLLPPPVYPPPVDAPCEGGGELPPPVYPPSWGCADGIPCTPEGEQIDIFYSRFEPTVCAQFFAECELSEGVLSLFLAFTETNGQPERDRYVTGLTEFYKANPNKVTEHYDAILELTGGPSVPSGIVEKTLVPNPTSDYPVNGITYTPDGIPCSPEGEQIDIFYSRFEPTVCAQFFAECELSEGVLSLFLAFTETNGQPERDRYVTGLTEFYKANPNKVTEHYDAILELTGGPSVPDGIVGELLVANPSTRDSESSVVGPSVPPGTVRKTLVPNPSLSPEPVCGGGGGY